MSFVCLNLKKNLGAPRTPEEAIRLIQSLDSTVRAGQRVDDLALIIRNLLKDEQGSRAHGILSELRATANDAVESLLRKTQLTRRTHYEGTLRGDTEFWRRCFEQWGRGSGYRERVAGLSDGWFAGGEQKARLKSRARVRPVRLGRPDMSA